MTPEQLSKLTDSQKRVMIAEACGIQPHKGTSAIARVLNDCTLPDYLNDLNAMHEAEATLTDVQYIKWAIHLNQLWLNENNSKRILRSASATASQRANAFLLTI